MNSNPPAIPKLLLLAAACLLALSAPASAEEDLGDFWNFMGEEAKNLTVATSRPESVFDSVSNVTVIDRAAIERYNYSTVSEALRAVPGMTVTRTYLMHNVPTARGILQEHYANKVLVMVDNVPMWNAVTGEGDLDRVDIDAVERIEVLLGPASVLYGSNALTGAVNIVLRKPDRDGTQARVTGGIASSHRTHASSLDVSRAGGLYTWRGAGAAYSVSANARNAEQPAVHFTDEAGAENLLPEYLNSRSASFAGSYGRSTVLANVFHTDQVYLGNSLDLASGELFGAAKDGAALSYSYNFEPAWGDLKYTGTFDWQHRDIPRDSTDNLRSDIAGSRVVNTLGAVLPFDGGFHLEGGASSDYRCAQRYLNYYSHTGAHSDDNSMDGRSSRENSVHLQLGRTGRDWKFLAGSRYTENNQAGDNLSSRVSLIRMFDKHNSLKAMFSQSFRSPTPFEQYFLTPSTTVVGNPGLKPERAETLEVSYLRMAGPLFLHLTAYRARYIDTIFRDRGDFTRDGVLYANSNHYSNAPGFGAEGMELTARYTGRNLAAYLALARSRGDRGDQHTVPAVLSLPAADTWNFRYNPDYTASGGLAHEAGNYFSAFNFNLLGPARSLRGRLPSQFWADLSVGFRKGRTRHTLAVRNVTGNLVEVPEYVRLRSVQRIPLYTGRRLEYSFDCRF